jgi:hypothetical protein
MAALAARNKFKRNRASFSIGYRIFYELPDPIEYSIAHSYETSNNIFYRIFSNEIV